MATHRFHPTTFHNSLGSHAAVLRVGDGDTVITDTLDAHGFAGDGSKPGRDPNPMSGPFFVEGAEPGDCLEVRIDRIDMNRNDGWTRSGLAWHVVDPSEVRNMPARDKTVWTIDRNMQKIALREPPTALRNWSAALDPMVGCLGVAPADGQAISTATSGPFGGNMDYNRIKAGTTIRFPVTAPGGLFFIGDVHGAQGDGEISGTGIETSAEVQFSVRVCKGKPIGWPRGETTEDMFTIGNARPLEQALQHATTEMLNWLQQDHGLDRLSASHVLGMAVRYDVANVFNPAFSVACRIPKTALKGL